MRAVLLALLVFCSAAPAFAITQKSPPQLRAITARDRVLVLAPHPDDESLGVGGLIEKAVAAYAKIRVVIATNGEANMWAQRFVEHRIYIGDRERRRWGKRRQGEALRALAVLGVSPCDVVFLDLPDQGMTGLLMEQDGVARAKFYAALADWKPTIAAFPSRYDLHPDHNACFVLARLALGSPNGKRLVELEYLVHRKPLADRRGAVVVKLAPREVQKKRDAILCHESQTALSKHSLLGFAQPDEIFFAPGAPRSLDCNHPIHFAKANRTSVEIQFPNSKTQRAYRNAPLFFISDHARGKYRLPLDGAWRFDLPFKWATRQLFAKLDARGLFLDRAGWREVPVVAR